MENQSNISSQKENKEQLPFTLYRHFDSNDNLLYVGISNNHIRRLSEHEKNSHWINDVAYIKIEKFKTLEDVLLAEKTAIINEKPLHNIINNRNNIKKTSNLSIDISLDKTLKNNIKRQALLDSRKAALKIREEKVKVKLAKEKELLSQKENIKFTENELILIENLKLHIQMIRKLYGNFKCTSSTIENNVSFVYKQFNSEEDIKFFIDSLSFSYGDFEMKILNSFDTDDKIYFKSNINLKNIGNMANHIWLKKEIDKLNIIFDTEQKTDESNYLLSQEDAKLYLNNLDSYDINTVDILDDLNKNENDFIISSLKKQNDVQVLTFKYTDKLKENICDKLGINIVLRKLNSKNQSVSQYNSLFSFTEVSNNMIYAVIKKSLYETIML